MLQSAILSALHGFSTTAAGETAAAPSADYSLEQNYPNPFNPSTSIKYSIPRYSKVIVKVFDILGKELETLVNEDRQPGIYDLTWNTAALQRHLLLSDAGRKLH